MKLPTAVDVHVAAERIADAVRETPLLEAPGLPGGPVFVKAECLQWTGSFKFRGATNRLRLLDDAALRRGVVAYSSGNHGFAVAEAARRAGSSAVIVVPRDAPEAKIAGILGAGAQLRFYDRRTDDREALAMKIANEEGRAIIEPYDHPETIAGQGTVGVEALRQARLAGVSFSRVLCCVGGGGLIAGVGLAMKAASPDIQLIGVEPEAGADHARSLVAGAPTFAEKPGESLCDGLMASKPGTVTFAVNKDQLDGVALVSDSEVLDAMRYAFNTLRLVLEPSGAAALAAALKAPMDCGPTLVVLTGGNVSPSLFRDMLASGSTGAAN